MIENGHSWSSIKKYNLSEIGVFFKIIVLRERERKFENLSYLWMGNNLSHEGLKEVLEEDKKNKQVPPEETTKEWNRLKSFMSKQR